MDSPAPRDKPKLSKAKQRVLEQQAHAEATRKRMLWLKWALCAATLSGMAMAPKLWEADRPFPTIPAFGWLPGLPQAITVTLALCLVLSLAFVAWRPRPGYWAWTPAGIGLFLALFDMSRLQPWFFEYALILIGLGLFQWEAPDSKRSRAAWGACAAVPIGIYFWSGLQKINAAFAHEVFPWLLHPLGKDLSAALSSLWPIAPIAEASIGLLLLIPRTRLVGLVGAVVMHGLILFALSPLGQNYDSIVWPWNIWVTVIAFVLFYRNDEKIVVNAWQSNLGRFILALIWAMPVFSFFGLWDGFISGSYYSGKLRDGWIYLTKDGYDHLPREYAEGNTGLTQEQQGRYRLDILGWSMSKLNAPPYGEPRYYASLAAKLQKLGVPALDMVLVVRDQPTLTYDRSTYSQIPLPGNSP